jgi:hypothetical protein
VNRKKSADIAKTNVSTRQKFYSSAARALRSEHQPMATRLLADVHWSLAGIIARALVEEGSKNMATLRRTKIFFMADIICQRTGRVKSNPIN